MNKNWADLKKDDKLYLLIPQFDDKGLFNRYIYQESKVINIHYYAWCINIRFKYTNKHGYRERVELCINKYKFDNIIVSTRKETSWAKEYIPKLGELLVAYDKDNLNQGYQNILDIQLLLYKNELEILKTKIEYLENEKNKRF